MDNDQESLAAALVGLRKIRDMEDIDGDEFDHAMGIAIGILEEMTTPIIPPYGGVEVDAQAGKEDRPRYLDWFKNDDRPDFEGYPGQGGFTE